MKKLEYIFLAFALLFSFAACSDDDKLIYNPANAKAGELLPINNAYIFEASQSRQVFATFQWGKIDFGYQAAVTYTLEADIAGNNFANAQEVTATTNLTADVTVGAMNSVMIKLLAIYDLPQETEQVVEFRIAGSISKAADAVYTNVIFTSITPYAADIEYPTLSVMGGYSGWNWDNAQGLFDFDNSGTYQGWIFFDGKAADGFKVAKYKINNEGNFDWDNDANWGLEDGQVVEPEAPSIILWSDGGSKNIEKIYTKNYYNFKFDTGTATLTRVQGIDQLGIAGDGANGWDKDKNLDIPFEFDNENQLFVVTATLKDGKIKFRADNNWDLNFGGANGELSQGGSDIEVTAGTYKITLNLNNPENMTYTLEGATALDPDKITAPVFSLTDNIEIAENGSTEINWQAVDFSGQEASKVVYTVEIDKKGANFANAQSLGRTEATSLTVSGSNLLAAVKTMDGDLDVETEVEMRIVATVSGVTVTYTSAVSSIKVKVTPKPAFPSEMYMIGEEFGNWSWNDAGVVSLVPVNGKEGNFWTIRYLTGGKQFKWSDEKNWDSNNFAQLSEAPIGYKLDGGNAVVEADGLYIIYIDMPNGKIAIETAKVYGIGNVFGNWDTAAHPFTIDGRKMSITANNKDELRMYANSSISTVGGDWWRMEFIIIDGKIEYRGNGDDQQRVEVEAGQIVTLDFNAGTGTIE